MKKMIMILGVISIIILSVGIIFKMFHWHPAGIILLLGAAALLAFFIIYLLKGISPLTTSLEKAGGISGGITMCLVLIAFVFKAQHWPGAHILIIISEIGLLVTSILLVIGSFYETDHTKQSIKTLFAFTLMTITLMLGMFTIILS